MVPGETDLSAEDIKKKMWCFRNDIVSEEDCDGAEMMMPEMEAGAKGPGGGKPPSGGGKEGGQGGRGGGRGGQGMAGNGKGNTAGMGDMMRGAISGARQEMLDKMGSGRSGVGKKSDKAMGKVPGIGKVLGGNGKVLSVPAGLVDINLALVRPSCHCQ